MKLCVVSKANGMRRSEAKTPRDSYDVEHTEPAGRRTMTIPQHSITAGIDVGDRYSHLCLLVLCLKRSRRDGQWISSLAYWMSLSGGAI